jgi:hypothetical protein
LQIKEKRNLEDYAQRKQYACWALSRPMSIFSPFIIIVTKYLNSISFLRYFFLAIVSIDTGEGVSIGLFFVPRYKK